MDSEKSWCPRRRPTDQLLKQSLLAVILLAGASSTVAAQEPRAESPRLDRFLESVQTLSADFEQELRGADGRLIQSASGTFSLKRPNRFLWSYREPIEQLVVADGERLWMYDVELEQVTVTPLDDTVTASPAMLLSGDADVRESFDVVETFEADGLSWTRLAPTIAGADFSSIAVAFDGSLPAVLEFVDGLDETTQIVFDNVVINPELGNRLFDFAPPAGVDVIGDED
jgi:outer membrane lipoprotein carrier protein